MRVHNVSDPVYFPNSKGGAQADSEHHKPASWYADGELVRTAYEQHPEDDDWSQPGKLVREVMDDRPGTGWSATSWGRCSPRDRTGAAARPSGTSGTSIRKWASGSRRASVPDSPDRQIAPR